MDVVLLPVGYQWDWVTSPSGVARLLPLSNSGQRKGNKTKSPHFHIILYVDDVVLFIEETYLSLDLA